MSFFRSVVIVAMITTIATAESPFSRNFKNDEDNHENIKKDMGLFMQNDDKHLRRFNKDNKGDTKSSQEHEGFKKKAEVEDESIISKIHKHVHNHQIHKHQRKQQRKSFAAKQLKPVYEQQEGESKEGDQLPKVNFSYRFNMLFSFFTQNNQKNTFIVAIYPPINIKQKTRV